MIQQLSKTPNFNILKCNKFFLVLFSMSIINFLFMHYQILLTCGFELYYYKTSFFDNLFFCTVDVIVIYIISFLLSFFNTKISLFITFVFSLIFSFCNVFYSRFFGQYLSLSSIEQINNLYDKAVINSMLTGFTYYDLYYLFILLLFWRLFTKLRIYNLSKKSFHTIGICFFSLLSIVLILHLSYVFVSKKDKIWYTINPLTHFNHLLPNWTTFHKGFVRTYIIDNIKYFNNNYSLNEEQINEIEKDYKDYTLRTSNHTLNENIENVIFILVESYLSETSDLFVDGKEITPFLNKLKRDDNVYYNGKMRSHINLGESSDGQFTYMTGLLPLRSEITISKVDDCYPLGLPRLLKNANIIHDSQIIVPTSPTTWKQKSMNAIYGINNIYSKIDYYEDKKIFDDLNDEDIFTLSYQKDKSINTHYFSLVLTMSMHSPYDFPEDTKFILNSKLPKKYLNYLNSCHFFDQQINIYIKKLKESGIYDKSLIVITADHEAHPKQLDMVGKISTNIPLYIINGGIDKTNAWKGDCNQLDVYTTLLDILGIDCEWRGLGHTLLNPNYINSVSEKTWKISDEIIYGKYFKNKHLKPIQKHIKKLE